MVASGLAIETATVALVVAGCSAAVSLTGLVWQLMLYRLSGARLDVRLRPAVLSLHGRLASGEERGWRRQVPQLDRIRLEDGFVDLAEIRVVNIGRSPVTVSGVTLDFGWSKRPWLRNTLGGIPVPIPYGVEHAGDHRLEVGASLTMYVDHMPLVDDVRHERPAVRSVRASAQGAGKRPTRSKWRRRWRLSSNRRIALTYAPELSNRIETFRRVFRVVYPRNITKLYDAWIKVGSLYSEGGEKPTADMVAECLARLFDQESLDLVLFLTAQDIVRTYDGPDHKKPPADLSQ